MEDTNWISLKNIEDNEKIWAGTKIRIYNVGLNVKDKQEDYYEYLVSFIYENNEYLQLTNLSEGEGGNSYVTTSSDSSINKNAGSFFQKYA